MCCSYREQSQEHGARGDLGGRGSQREASVSVSQRQLLCHGEGLRGVSSLGEAEDSPIQDLLRETSPVFFWVFYHTLVPEL